MNARTILAGALLVFAMASLGLGIWGEVRGQPAGRGEVPDSAATADADKTIVYYMHATFRCVTCNAVESMAQKLIRAEFDDAVRAGRLEWRPVNYQENDALARRYKVAGNMIVVARFESGEEVETRRLDRVMELADRRDEFMAYVRQGIQFQPADAAGVPMALWAALAAAFGFGLWTAVSPCPLATNIAAVSFLSRSAAQPRKVLSSGLAYTLGRTAVYVGLGVLILYILQMPWAGGDNPGQASSSISRLLLKYGGMVIGPVLIVAGMLLLGLLSFSGSLNVGGQSLQQRASGGGVKWAFALGVLFALSFCPISATIFFGSMITLSTQNRSPVLLPTAFGIATALPVIVFAFLIAFAGQYVGKVFNRMTQIDRWLRRTTGVVFIVAGLYYTLTHVYGVPDPMA